MSNALLLLLLALLFAGTGKSREFIPIRIVINGQFNEYIFHALELNGRPFVRWPIDRLFARRSHQTAIDM